jgi:hypothetical protein
VLSFDKGWENQSGIAIVQLSNAKRRTEQRPRPTGSEGEEGRKNTVEK